MNVKDLKYRVGFSYIPGIGHVRFKHLEDYFGDMEAAWKATPSQLKEARIEDKVIRTIVSNRDKISPDAVMQRITRLDITALTWHDDIYPARLKEIYGCPPVLYVLGDITAADEWSVAVVGTRKVSAYGRQVTEEIVSQLSQSRITVVSGLARGIDSIAHRTAVENGGRTIAVLACGLDIIYPPENSELARRITNNGALVSEYPPGTKPRPEYFPRRNRLISGLSLGTLVTEADRGSGSLITAALALEQNREVMAIPGSIFSPGSKGTNNIIQQGAKLVTCCQDILVELNLGAAAQQMEFKEIVPETETESVLLKNLSSEPVHIDDICSGSGLPVSTVSGTLAMMELKGMIRSVGNMSYVLAREVRENYGVNIG